MQSSYVPISAMQMTCDQTLKILVDILVLLFGFLGPSGRAWGRTRTKTVGPRPYLVYSWRRHCSLRTEHITLGSAYSDTAAVTSCSRQSVRKVMDCNKLNKVLSSSSYTAPIALGIYRIRQEVE